MNKLNVREPAAFVDNNNGTISVGLDPLFGNGGRVVTLSFLQIKVLMCLAQIRGRIIRRELSDAIFGLGRKSDSQRASLSRSLSRLLKQRLIVPKDGFVSLSSKGHETVEKLCRVSRGLKELMQQRGER